MPARELPADFLAQADRDFLPHLSVDCAIFGCDAGALRVLLLRWKHLDRWSLPGGFVRRDESVDDAAARVLHERTGLERVFLRQFHAFGGTDRHEDSGIPALEAMGVLVPRDHWLVRRVVSIGYLALVDLARAEVTPDALTVECRWWPVHGRPPLLFDHDEVVARALDTLRAGLDTLPLAHLLPGTFTMPELQRLYETVLGRTLDRRNFQKHALDLGMLERLPERRTGVPRRAPWLYRFVRG